MFIDHVKIYIKAGDGGNGAVSFRREKYVAAGGPDGGDGGRGGNIIFRVDTGVNTLLAFKYRHKVIAENGGNGRGGKLHGATAEDLVILVPPGTLIKDEESGKVIHDMTDNDGADYLCCRGGRGGWGNRHFATPTRQIPMFAKSGKKGEEKNLVLELKMLADVGLIGYPSVGKSSILARISAARPKIADYHFTTLSPNLGVVSISAEEGFVAADIPGLIEGASEGVGLGHAFLRHVDRCRMLVHIVDVAGSEGRDPIEDFEKINLELERFNPELAERPQIVAANKIDLASDEQRERFKAYIEEKGYEYFEMCAPIVEGTKEVIDAVAAKLATLPPVVRYEQEEIPLDMLVKKQNTGFTITVQDDVYIVEAEWLIKILCRTDLDDYESLQYFQRVLISSGIIDALREKGINEGDIVSIYDYEFEFME